MDRKTAPYLILTAFILAACGLPGPSSSEDAQLVSAEKTLAALEQLAANAQPATPTDTPIPPSPSEPPAQEGAYLLGQWRAVDITDGSNMTLNFDWDSNGGMVFELYDDGATTCGGTPLYEFNASGSVDFTGQDRFKATGSGMCDGAAEVVNFAIDMSYEAAIGILTESGGQTWKR